MALSKLKASPFDIEQFLINHGLEIRRRGKKAEIKLCPFCGGGDHNDLWKCVVYLDDTGGNYKCMRGSCGATGSFWQLVEHFGEDPKKFYERDGTDWTPRPTMKLSTGATTFVPVAANFEFTAAPLDYNELPLTRQAVDYLQLRGMSADLLESAPIWCDDRGNICFGYYHKGELCMVKVRVPRKRSEGELKAWQAWKGGLHPLWCFERCDPKVPRLVVTFGEYDALVLQQAGIPNVVSMPCGDQDLNWINIHWDELQKYHEIVLWPDNDKSGHDAMLRIAERLDYQKLRVVKSPYKDPNEHLIYRMQEIADEVDQELRDMVDTAEWLQKGDLDQLAEVLDEVRSFTGYTSGIEPLDKLTGGYFFGQLIVHFGEPKSGKSMGVNQITAMAVEEGARVCVWAGEDTPHDYKYKLYTHIAGPKGVDILRSERTGTEYARVKPEVSRAIDNWVRDRVILLNPRSLVTEELLIGNFELAFQRYGCDVFVVDNLMKLVYARDSENVFARQARIVQELSRFAKEKRVIVHLVTHTNKKAGANTNEPPCRDNVSGAKEIINLCDRAQFWWRIPRTAGGRFGQSESMTGIVADRVFGNEGQIELRYSTLNKRFATSREEWHRQYSLYGKPSEVRNYVDNEN